MTQQVSEDGISPLWGLSEHARRRAFARRAQRGASAALGHTPPRPIRIPKPPVRVVPKAKRRPGFKGSIASILQEVCTKHELRPSDIKGQCREHHVVLARHEVMYRARTEAGMTLAVIGRELGGRDHTTVRHGVDKHARRMKAVAV